MVVEKIILLVVIVFIIVFVWGFLKHILKLLVPVGIVILLIIAATTFLIYKDIADLRQNLRASSKKIILVNNDEVLTGFILNNGVKFLTSSQIRELSYSLEGRDYKGMLGSSYRLMVFDLNIVDRIGDGSIEIGTKAITKSEAVSILKSEDPSALLKENGIDEDDLGISRSDFNDRARAKAALFGIILSDEVLSPKNPLLLFSGFKEGQITIYPETAVFKAANILPSSLISAAGKAIFKTKEGVKSFAVEESE